MTAPRCGALIAIALINFVAYTPAQAQSKTAGELLAACKAFVDSTLEESNAFDGGICAGQIDALRNIGSSLDKDRRYCVPKEVTNLQATRVVVQWIERSRESLKQPFAVVAMTALKQTWPCK